MPKREIKMAKVTGRWHDNRHTLVKRSNDLGRRGQSQSNAEALQPHPDGGQADRSRIHRAKASPTAD
jgi:hypothetical protein